MNKFRLNKYTHRPYVRTSLPVVTSLCTCSDDVTVQFHLNKYTRKLDVMKAINDIEYVYGFTNRADALRVMRTDMFSEENGDRPQIQVRLSSTLVSEGQCKRTQHQPFSQKGAVQSWDGATLGPGIGHPPPKPPGWFVFALCGDFSSLLGGKYTVTHSKIRNGLDFVNELQAHLPSFPKQLIENRLLGAYESTSQSSQVFAVRSKFLPIDSF